MRIHSNITHAKKHPDTRIYIHAAVPYETLLMYGK